MLSSHVPRDGFSLHLTSTPSASVAGDFGGVVCNFGRVVGDSDVFWDFSKVVGGFGGVVGDFDGVVGDFDGLVVTSVVVSDSTDVEIVFVGDCASVVLVGFLGVSSFEFVKKLPIFSGLSVAREATEIESVGVPAGDGATKNGLFREQ